ncbi:MAG: hypothetical protein DSY37_02405 [Hyperthermus sp.]|nr:MAG: hypothetical protein DSY37_02405 [Hyperthermus sp.]
MDTGKAGRLHKNKPRRTSERSILAWTITTTAILAAWQLASTLKPSQIPSLQATLTWLLHEGAYTVAKQAATTLARTLAGFTIALAATLTLGYVYTTTGSSLVKNTIRTINTILQSISVLIWIVILIMLFGVMSPLPPILVSTLVSLPILSSTMIASLDTANPRLKELAALLGAPQTRLYTDFLLPHTLPQLAGAARAALGAALRISVVAEAFGSNGGVGYMIDKYYNLAEPRGVFAWGTILVALMVLTDKALLEPLEARVKQWTTLPQK